MPPAARNCTHTTGVFGYGEGVPLRIGTSGWQYADWRARFYPDRLAQRDWLDFYSSSFATVEANSTFYRLPREAVVARWAETTPDDFSISVKASRYLTHITRLRDPAESVALLMERLRPLGGKLGPILLQLPPNFRCDADLLEAALGAFPPGVKVAFEPRHPSWQTDEVDHVLERHDSALCLADKKGVTIPVRRTASWGYVRFHEGRASPHPCYGRTALKSWAHRLAQTWRRDEEVYAYFNNDHGGCAVRDARSFAALALQEGLAPTRVPEQPIPVGALDG